MDFIKDKLSSIGALIAVFGLMSMILHFLDYELRILGWIGQWGEGTAWAIRIGLIVVGAALFFMFGGTGHEDDEEE